MIGIIKDEDYVIVEFYPIFAPKNGRPKWSRVKLPIECSNFGEYGVAWNKCGIWIMWGHSTYHSFRSFLKDISTRISKCKRG